ncbi:MAG: carboxypeptidase regulatory-like domain-containing protein [Planctomycetota bacterium]
MADAVAALDGPYREVVLLRFYEGLPPREIASRLEVPVATVRTRVRRALEALRTRLDERHGGDRRAWLAGLAPLAVLRPAATTGLLATLGASLMSIPLKLLLGGGAVAALLLWGTSLLAPGDAPPATPEVDGVTALAAHRDGETAPGGVADPGQGGPADRGDAAGRTELRPEGAARRIVTISGRVTDEQRRPLAGARVSSATDPEYPAVETADDGRYELVLGRSFGDKVLWVQAEDMAWVEEVVEVPVGRLRVELDFVLHRGFAVSGRVVDEDGAPVPGAMVTASPRGGGQEPCGEDGGFVLRGLDPAAEVLRLRASAPDLQPGLLVWRQGQARDGLELRLERGLVLRGRVVDALDRPVPGAWIMVAPALSNSVEWAAGSGEDGRFELHRLPPGELEVLVQRFDDAEGGFAPWFTRLDAARAAGAELRVELSRSGMIRGRVVDELGRPVEGASVGYDVGLVSVRRTWPTGADGAFAVDRVPTGRVLLRGSKEGYCDADGVYATSGRADVELVLARRAGFRGRVVDAATGAAVRDFRVRVLDPELRPGEVAAAGLWSQWVEEGLRVQDDEGRFTSGDEALRAGSVVGLLVTAEGYAPARIARHRCEVEPAELVVELREAGHAVLRLVAEADGRPLAGARVRRFAAYQPLRLSRHEKPWGSGFATADERGRVRFDGVGDEDWYVLVEHPAVGRRIHGPCRPVAGDELVLRLARAGSVTGRVLLPGKAAAARVPVQLRAIGVRGVEILEYEAVTDAGGAFTFEAVPDGRWRLSWPDRRAQASATRLARDLVVEAGKEATVDLDLDLGPARLRVEVVAAGRLPSPLRLALTPLDDGAPLALRGGLFDGASTELTSLPEGRYHVEVDHWDYRRSEYWQGEAEVTLSGADRRAVRITLERRD